MKYYKILCYASALLFSYLFIMILFFPHQFPNSIGIEAETGTLVVLRRAAMFMLGLVFLFFFSARIKDVQARSIISLSGGITYLGLATMSITEYLQGNLSSGIVGPFVMETLFGLAFLAVSFIGDKYDKEEKVEK